MPTSPSETTYDLAVLGAGPAGLAAAAAAARAGCRVALLDAAPRVGGQFWRHRPGDDGTGQHDWPTFERLRAELDTPGVAHLPGHQVWHVTPGCTVHALVGDDDVRIAARSVLVATGAYDRQLPFPGWDTPGVFTAGGAQALLKGHGVVAGRRIVVAGTGPFLLPVAAGLAESGAEVLGVFEAGRPTGYARHPAAVARAAGKLAEGAGYLRTLRRHRVPYRTRHTVVAAHGAESVHAVTVARLDADWRPVPGSHRTLDCDTVCVGYGFTPQLELGLQLGCATRQAADGSLVLEVDTAQRTSVPGVYAAGETCGVGGAALAVVEGELAGLAVARRRDGAAPPGRLRGLLRRRSALRAFAAAMHDASRVPDGWSSWLTTDTVLCRCEEVTVGQVRAAVTELGADDARAVKLLARPGMGRCQGRVCGYPTARLVAAAHGRAVGDADLAGFAERPVAQPVTLGLLAARDTARDD